MSATPSLAGEIAQLHELFKLGALTEDEFNAAKQATIRGFMSGTATAPAPPPPSSAVSAPPAVSGPGPATPAAVADPSVPAPPPPPPAAAPLPLDAAAPPAAPRTMNDWQRLWSTSPIRSSIPANAAAGASSSSFFSTVLTDPVDARMQALRCLDRVFRNLLAHPAEPKYRHIREANKVIAQELLPVEASRVLLEYAGFVREAESSEALTAPSPTAPTNPSPQQTSAPPPSSSWVWVQKSAATEAVRSVTGAARVAQYLLEVVGEQQSRRYGLQQLWRSVALEVRLEQAARALHSSTDGDPLEVHSERDEAESVEPEEQQQSLTSSSAAAVPEQQQHSTAAPTESPFLAYLVACYTLDEAGDGLYSSLHNLQTLLALYEAIAAQTEETSSSASANPWLAQAAVKPPATYSLITTAEVYTAVVLQRGAVELLVHGCGAHLWPSPAVATAAPSVSHESSKADSTAAQAFYTVCLCPAGLHHDEAALHTRRCLRLLRRLCREVEHVRQQRTQAARAAAEKSMRQELRRERQRQQLEQCHVREDVPPEQQLQARRMRLNNGGVIGAARHPRLLSSASSISSDEEKREASPSLATRHHSTPGESVGGVSEARRRIPIADALAILMGKKSPPTSRPPPADASSTS